MKVSRSVRNRKLSTKQALQIIREDQIDSLEDAEQRNVPKVDTGVEKAEETEHHLQAAISASQAAAVGGKVAQIYIPTPDTIQSSVKYDQLYPTVFSDSATYIRFSSTVEDCSGCPYSLIEEDDEFLRSFNEKRDVSTQCSEDQFEEVMNFFEETAQTKQPYAAVDSPPVVMWKEMEDAFDETYDQELRSFARIIYEHWKSRRIDSGNRSLISGLKFETGADTDDGDPYVCFRRREVRQVRKTRGRDAQSAEKLKKLRKELEEARQIMTLVRERESTKRDQLTIDRQLFVERTSLRQVKRSLPEKYSEGDEDLLINQKPQKKLLVGEDRSPHKGPLINPPPRPDSRNTEADLVSLQDILADKENKIEKEINKDIEKHKKWNEGWVDLTTAPLTPPSEESMGSEFRTAVAEYLPTPPTSASSEDFMDIDGGIGSPSRPKEESIAVRYAPPTYDGPCRSQPSFRRRIGRGGRLMIDRRGMQLESKDGLNEAIIDRFKYDQDDDNDDEVPKYFIDPYDKFSLAFRAKKNPQSMIQAHIQAAKQRAQIEATSSIAATKSSSNTSVSNLPRNPPSG